MVHSGLAFLVLKSSRIVLCNAGLMGHGTPVFVYQVPSCICPFVVKTRTPEQIHPALPGVQVCRRRNDLCVYLYHSAVMGEKLLRGLIDVSVRHGLPVQGTCRITYAGEYRQENNSGDPLQMRDATLPGYGTSPENPVRVGSGSLLSRVSRPTRGEPPPLSLYIDHRSIEPYEGNQ
jgi:hypothetical protein